MAGALRQSGLDPRSLQLEITEGVAMEDAGATAAKLKELKNLGVRVALDDFGTGYSSLNYLKNFSVDKLKIDRSFVEGLGSDLEDTAIVGAVVALAKSLDLSVTAEGIETAGQLDRLRALGCDLGQGFYFFRPLEGDATSALLRGSPPGDALRGS